MDDLVQRLSALRSLIREVNLLTQHLITLRSHLPTGTTKYSSAPRGGKTGDPVARVATDIADVSRMLEQRRADCVAEMKRLYTFIDSIEDSLIRLIMTLRYLEGKSWREVAVAIGESDEQYPRRHHNRCLENLTDDQIRILYEE